MPNSPTTEQNIESCQLKCYITEACNYWVWNKANSACFLKSEKHEENRRDDHDFKTSAKHCFKCAKWGFYYTGNDLPNMPLFAKGQYDCKMLCQQNNDCKYWAWELANNSKCSLKTAKDESRKISKTGMYFGPKYC